jgi:thiamine-monophosphate kinase
MKLSQWGELKLVDHIRRRFASAGPYLAAGIGDDAAVLKSAIHHKSGKDLLWTTDVLVEGVDFELAYCPLHQIGYKALAANLSDIAAMGGIPRFFLVALGLSRDLTVRQLDLLYEGMMDLAHEFEVKLSGGDISAVQGPIFIAMTVLGETERGRALMRSGAKPGDQIFVSGTLGDAAAGLEVAKLGLRMSTSRLLLLQRQFYPVPRVKEGRLLSMRHLVSAMIDLSDGLASDLRRVCEESNVGAVVEADAVPMSPLLIQYTRQKRGNPLDYALKGGEDFELLLTVPQAKINPLIRLMKEKRLRLTQIGQILPKTSGLRLKKTNGKTVAFPKRGYEHFA